jgi:hypothetical protein
MNRIYICGAMTGRPDLNKPAFHAAARQLRAAGFDAVNPAEICPDAAAHWAECMRKDIAQLVTCDAIALLPDSEESRGAKLERQIATALGMPVIPLAEFVREFCRAAA